MFRSMRKRFSMSPRTCDQGCLSRRPKATTAPRCQERILGNLGIKVGGDSGKEALIGLKLSPMMQSNSSNRRSNTRPHRSCTSLSMRLMTPVRRPRNLSIAIRSAALQSLITFYRNTHSKMQWVVARHCVTRNWHCFLAPTWESRCIAKSTLPASPTLMNRSARSSIACRNRTWPRILGSSLPLTTASRWDAMAWSANRTCMTTACECPSLLLGRTLGPESPFPIRSTFKTSSQPPLNLLEFRCLHTSNSKA